ncbi:FAD:protein FMN transferase [Paucibacter sp. B2R-40]|uniref:FAD:protein FMN transferase n=1 Tax=Paucibacter sp. B2R-40 TaxID=2893554 RepID=UPI0021E458B0|nr:FAD:protein FMN transferase [Paucibacter sp. B2R-40]MCV2356315.1 FAD:protein FMN transferase [Paucibacter sp. B2R-40]
MTLTMDRRVLLPAHVAPATPALGEQLYVLDGQSMGTRWSVKFYGPCGLDCAPLQRGLEARLAEVVARMSPWEPDSDLRRFGRAQPASWVAISEPCGQVLRMALEVAQASGGAFDPAAAALVRAWGFGAGLRHDEPGFVMPAAAPQAAGLGWQDLPLQRAVGGWEVWQPGGLELDLCGIAKGFAVDQMAEFLLDCGLPHHLVEVGGELRGAGLKPNGQPWWVQLEAVPGAAGLNGSVLALHGLAVATSGDYRNCFVDTQGRSRSHTLDPRSGEPIKHGLASVSVLHSSCCWADAWATALMVLGPEDGPALAAELGLAALFVLREPGWREILSPALQAMLQA